MNVLLAPVSGITMLKDVPTVYFPVMWFENKAGVPDNLVFKMKLMANLHEILQGIGCIQIGVAVAIGIISLIVFLARKKSEEDQCPILSQSHHEDSQEENEVLDE